MLPNRGWPLRSIVGAAIPRPRPFNRIRVSHRQVHTQYTNRKFQDHVLTSIIQYSTQFSVRRPTQPPRLRQFAIPPTSLFCRNQSTTAAPSPTITPVQTESSSTFVESLGDITSAPDYSQIPEKIGYLKELGLDFGWGPTSVVQWMLEHVHIYTATPWWASIVITTVIIRAAMFPLVMRQSHEMSKMMAMKPIIDEVKAKQAVLRASGDPQLAAQARLEIQKHLKAADISMPMVWIPMLLQVPLGFGAFKLTRAAAALPVPAWEHGGIAWITDLTVPDPYLVIPFTMLATMHMLARVCLHPSHNLYVMLTIVHNRWEAKPAPMS
jgi:YidC/Oxa1 family membrane protein insertase